MWIQVRSIDGKKTVRVDNLSKLTKIEALRERLVDQFDAPTEAQRLFFRGKQLVDGHSLFDYNVGLNDLIQILTRKLPVPSSNDLKETNGYASSGDEGNSSDKENQKPPSPELPAATVSLDDDFTDSTYKMGDIIDAQDVSIGAWFEAKIVKITRASENDEAENKSKEDGNNNSEINNRGNQSQSNNSTVIQNGAEGMECDSSVENKEEKDSASSATDETKNTHSNSISANNHDNLDSMSNSAESSKSSGEKSKPNANLECQLPENDPYLYHITYEGYDDVEKLRSKHVRPRARVCLQMADITEGMKVMTNYNFDDPDERGFWYDCVITKKVDTRTQKQLWATMFIGKELTPLHDCKLLFINEVFAIEKPGTQLNEKTDSHNPSMSPTKRKNKPDCDHCQDNPKRKCKHCACCVCGSKHDPDKQILCDECNQAYHLSCLQPPLTSVPEEDEWYCPDCKVDDTKIVKAGEKLKESKKKSKMASATSVSSRDWGKGMACVGRTKECTIVPPNHFGPVPGGEVGMMWKFRVQVSEAGVHRPHVAGIHGREENGAFSIVLSGGYEDDEDWGEEFTYTGSGGRDLSGNKRTAEQSCDQKLTRMNKALAKNCNATINNKDGADSGDKWKGGKPVRVVRNCKGRKHSKYAPEEGNRYDGIYKIVKYWPEKGKSGFIVWRYLLRRDDPTPAPWTAAGKKRTRTMGFEMVYPEGYLEAQKEKERLKEIEEEEETPKGKGRGKGKKRKAEGSPEKTPKKVKIVNYKISDEQLKLIKKDDLNKKLWKEALNVEREGYQKFLAKVEEVFMCVCCQDLSYKPVTLKCSHNVCKPCLSRSFKAEVYSCPACRYDLTKEFKMPVNQPLTSVLNALFPGYEAGRVS